MFFSKSNAYGYGYSNSNSNGNGDTYAAETCSDAKAAPHTATSAVVRRPNQSLKPTAGRHDDVARNTFMKFARAKINAALI